MKNFEFRIKNSSFEIHALHLRQHGHLARLQLEPGLFFDPFLVEKKDDVVALFEVDAERCRRPKLHLESMEIADARLRAQLAESIQEDAVICADDPQIVIAEI